MPPKRRYSERLQSRSPRRSETQSDERSTAYDNSKRRRNEPQDGLPTVLSTRISPNRDTPSTDSRTELEGDEVLFLLGTATIKLRREQLQEAFGYFTKFPTEEFPKKFSRSCKDPPNWSYCCLLPSKEVNIDNNHQQNVPLQFVETYQTLLQIVCVDAQTLRVSLKGKEPDHLAKVASLLSRYGATDSVKFDFGGHLLDAVVEKDLLGDHPCVMLEIGFFLKREDYFCTAMIEVVRQYHTTKSDVRRLPKDLEDSVFENVRKLEACVQAVRMDILWTLLITSNSNSMLASGVILQHMLESHEEAIFTTEPTNPKVYHALRALRDWHPSRFQNRMVPNVYYQLRKHDQMISSTMEILSDLREMNEDMVEQAEGQIWEGNHFRLGLVYGEGERMLQEIHELIDPIMDNVHPWFVVEPPINFPWR
ncbi:hypothetical protein B0J12DRAFT_728588 [Macrophomina phaseolina]|uniref:BTB/POZ-like protein n=1 Tax=Macrophomina phaseolina TaxID=35725 RepID=A0ABQ8G954_9PEZI|nr:hypothetical protein B0J12DRAFT_728588 [Macrophomina phaseolina]